MAQASQRDVRAFEISQEGQPEALPAADLNPDLSRAISEYNPADAFAAPAPLSSQIKDTDISNIIKGAMESMSRAASMKVGKYTPPDMQKYLDSVEQIRGIYNDNVNELTTQRAVATTAINAKIEGIEEEARAKIEESAADREKAQKIADINADIEHTMSTAGSAERIAKKTEIFSLLNDRGIAIKEALQENLQKLREEEAVNFADDPIRWLSGIFTIPQMSDQISAQQHESDVLNNEIAGVFHDIQSNIAAVKDAGEYRQKAVPAITAQQAAAKQNLVAAEAVSKVSDANLALVKQDSEFARQKFAEAVTLGSAEHAALTAKQEEARLKFEESSRAIMKADNDAKAKLMIAKLASDLQDRQQIDGILRLYEKRTGGVENSWNYTQFMRAPEEVRNFIVGRAMGFTGTTVGDAYFNLRGAERYGLIPGPGLPPQQKHALSYMHQYATELFDPIKTPDILKEQTKEQKQAFVTRKMNERFDRLQQDPTFDKDNNPFYEATPREVQLHSPLFVKSKQGKLLEAMIAGQVQPNTEMIVATLTNGAANVGEAAQMISQYYKLNMHVRNSMNDYKGLGYDLRNDSYHWRDTVPGSVFSSLQTTDLTKPEAVEAMLRKRDLVRTPGGIPQF